MERGGDPLREMANLAWWGRLRAIRETPRAAFRRSNLLKPFDLILDQLERYPDDAQERLRAASAEEIFAYLERVNSNQRWSPKRARETIRIYVGLFFDRVLGDEHRGDVNRLLSRKRLLRSAYLMYVREAIPDRVAEAADTAPDSPLDENSEPEDSGEEE